LLADWYAGTALCEGDDPRGSVWLELARMRAEDVLRLPVGEPGPIVGLAARFFAVPDADLLLEIASALEARARRIEALDVATAANADEDDDNARSFAPARTVALVPPLEFAAN
jgi:hypothetical protein